MDSLVFLYLFPSYFNFQQHPDPIFCIIFNISLPPHPNPNPQKKFYLFKTFEKSKSSHIYWTNDYELMVPCNRTQHCWTNNGGSCCVRLPVAYWTIFWLNDILARFGRKRAEINESKAFDENAPEISTISLHKVQLPAFIGNFIAQIQDLVIAEILLIQGPDC